MGQWPGAPALSPREGSHRTNLRLEALAPACPAVGNPEARGPSPWWTGEWHFRPVPPTTSTPTHRLQEGLLSGGLCSALLLRGWSRLRPTAGSASAWTATQGPCAGRVSWAPWLGGGERGTGCSWGQVSGTMSPSERNALLCLPGLCWTKCGPFQPLTVDGTLHTANPGAQAWAQTAEGGDPWAGLGEPVWVGADTARPPLLTLCVNQHDSVPTHSRQ